MVNGNRSQKLASRRTGTPSLRKEVVQILNARVEHKRAVGNVGAFIDWATAGTVSEISTDIAQGDNIGDRSGDVIRPLKFTFRHYSDCNVGEGAFRVIIFQDTMAAGAAPAVTAVLTGADFLSTYNAVNRQSGRFKILHEEYFTQVETSQTEQIFYTRTIAMKGSIHFVSTAAGAASAGRNTLYALFISDSAGAGQKRYDWSYELEFTDA